MESVSPRTITDSLEHDQRLDPLWYVLRTRSRHEKTVRDQLVRREVETFLPLAERWSRWKDRRKKVAFPLFPGYCFVAIELQWHTAGRAPGMVRIVLDGGVPARVPDSVIAEIRARERNGLVELPKRETFHVGDQVWILQGPFAGHLGLYAGMRAHERVLVLLALLGGQQRVELAKDDVESTR